MFQMVFREPWEQSLWTGQYWWETAKNTRRNGAKALENLYEGKDTRMLYKKKVLEQWSVHSIKESKKGRNKTWERTEREKVEWKKGYREGREVVGPASNPRIPLYDLKRMLFKEEIAPYKFG